MESRRKMNILGRYLRQMYHYLVSDVRSLDVSDEQLEVLVGLYSTGSLGESIDLASLLDMEESTVETHTQALYDDGLVESVDPPYELTPQAQFLINERFEDINV
jgi:DNA-binding MarR family transcriptional regulator